VDIEVEMPGKNQTPATRGTSAVGQLDDGDGEVHERERKAIKQHNSIIAGDRIEHLLAQQWRIKGLQ